MGKIPLPLGALLVVLSFLKCSQFPVFSKDSSPSSLFLGELLLASFLVPIHPLESNFVAVEEEEDLTPPRTNLIQG
ncbi:hypothetical protein VNO77_04538 [Canavalia gladiata]|uniref:Uncharacterized protein n=1 Tax=Canavalia gladiata TaxID=3824 RepID=A0AAN9MYQ2_CANGL